MTNVFVVANAKWRTAVCPFSDQQLKDALNGYIKIMLRFQNGFFMGKTYKIN